MWVCSDQSIRAVSPSREHRQLGGGEPPRPLGLSMAWTVSHAQTARKPHPLPQCQRVPASLQRTFQRTQLENPVLPIPPGACRPSSSHPRAGGPAASTGQLGACPGPWTPAENHAPAPMRTLCPSSPQVTPFSGHRELLGVARVSDRCLGSTGSEFARKGFEPRL